MNERIKQLAEQARQIGEYVNYGQIRLSPEQFEQKFAELIVKECAHVGFNAAYPDKGVVVLTAIKEHFGLDQ